MVIGWPFCGSVCMNVPEQVSVVLRGCARCLATCCSNRTWPFSVPTMSCRSGTTGALLGTRWAAANFPLPESATLTCEPSVHWNVPLKLFLPWPGFAEAIEAPSAIAAKTHRTTKDIRFILEPLLRSSRSNRKERITGVDAGQSAPLRSALNAVVSSEQIGPYCERAWTLRGRRRGVGAGRDRSPNSTADPDPADAERRS